MEDEMLFCQKCGTKVDIPSNTSEEVNQTVDSNSITYQNYNIPNNTINKKPAVRKGFKVGATICFVFAGIYALISIGISMMFGMTLFLGILGIMFLLLGKTPKEAKYMFGKTNGLTKGAFVGICIALAFVCFGVFVSTTEPPADITTSNTTQTQSVNNDEQKNISLKDIEKWYKSEMPTVSQNLIEYAQGVKGISNVNVTESKFRFGEEDGWYDCHYTYYFTCKVNGDKCKGEARAFRKYNDDNINWFHFEIYRDADWKTIVEEYDETSDKTIEEYYKELTSQYK